MRDLKGYIIQAENSHREVKITILAKDKPEALDIFEKIVYRDIEDLPLSEHYKIRRISEIN